MSTAEFGVNNVNLTTADPTAVICYLESSGNEYNGKLSARISALFVIGIISTVVTFFPVIAKRVKALRIPVYVYLFARYFGAGVIVATAFIHLLDPAYGEIGPNTCVGMTGNWASYSWCPSIVLAMVILIFLLDFSAARYVEIKYSMAPVPDLQIAITGEPDRRIPNANGHFAVALSHSNSDAETAAAKTEAIRTFEIQFQGEDFDTDFANDDPARDRSFKQQIAAFLILDFGFIFHSVTIGLNLGVFGGEFSILYPVLVFHQSFEGLGIGARMSVIPFKKSSWLPWILCAAYGLTTPIAIAVGLGVRTTYNLGSFTANMVAGVLDAMSAGILIYTGLVELLARDSCSIRGGRTITCGWSL